MNPPEGRLATARPGEVTAISIFHPLRGDGTREGGRRDVTSTKSLAPVFYRLGLLKEVSKKLLGMLNVLPYMVPVKK